MLKIFASILFVATVYAGPASAHGGGPAETMPLTNYTDMPSYRPKAFAPCVRSARTCEHVQWHQGFSRGN